MSQKTCDNTQLNWNKNVDVVFISARGEYGVDGIRSSGYQVYRPYKDKTLLGRILREIWFRLHLPERVWYNKGVLNNSPENIIIQDPLITRRYIDWIIAKMPNSVFHFTYCNMVGKAKHLIPAQLPKKIQVWTYDKHNAKKYDIHLFRSGGYSQSYIGKKEKKVYDVVYIGADKGRGEYILSLKRKMEQMGLNTKFIITADKRISRRKKYYSKRISYLEIIKLDNQSKAILNIILPHQMGATMRDYESIYNEVKLITNNKNIKNFDFYKKENVFILGEDDFGKLREFLNTPFQKIDSSILKKYSVEGMVEEIISRSNDVSNYNYKC